VSVFIWKDGKAHEFPGKLDDVQFYKLLGIPLASEERELRLRPETTRGEKQTLELIQ
jgi:hypothetical protein